MKILKWLLILVVSLLLLGIVVRAFVLSKYNPKINHELFNDSLHEIKTLEPLPNSFLNKFKELNELITVEERFFSIP